MGKVKDYYLNEMLLNLESEVSYLQDSLDRLKNGLEKIAGASDQANPMHLREVAETLLNGEPTTADKLNKEG